MSCRYSFAMQLGAALLGVLCQASTAWQSRAEAADPPAPQLDARAKQSRSQAIARGIAYLKATGQAEDGSFSKATGPAVTALVATALVRNGVPAADPSVARAVKYVESFIKPSGGIHQKESRYRNYETCLAILLFKELNQQGQYQETLANADRFLKGLQWDEGEGKSESDFEFGGSGYGRHARPDLSNTAFFIEALRATGNDADSQAIQRALLFVSRAQNLESPHNKTPFAAKNPDGGFYYTPAAGGTSQAGETPNGGLRSYASMTYAGLKSMIYAGVGPEDPRVQAAAKWIAKHYDLKSNPGMGDAGLYYYYHTFAKALSAMQVRQLVDVDGKPHDWRVELITELASRQRDDGAWTNGNERWLEGDANLVTAYALLALSYSN